MRAASLDAALGVRCWTLTGFLFPKNEESLPDLAVRQGERVMGVRHALFPVPTLGAHLAAAAGFPTLFSTASEVFGLRSRAVQRLAALNFE